MIAAILTKWSFDPSVFTGLAVLCAGYWWYARRERNPRQDRRFVAAMLIALLALESPLDFVADRYLFSAHMVQHLVLILGVAPLLALAVPDGFIADVKASLLAPLARFCVHPVVVFVAFVVDVWAWHAPPMYEATLHSEAVHVAEHLSFIAVSAAFWWVAFAPNDGVAQLPMIGRVAYVFLAGIPNTLLGALITFAPVVLYPSYQLALEQPGLGRALQLQWGITALTDQELGGLLMWVPGGFVYLAVIVAIFMSSFARPSAAEAEPA
ncbi:MAG TPA: cytochrome c oxidase assembly protein [Chloroflexota bacterium]|nr:cytochrome c oxidase assembly protein [Chloroflexota bacterium]